MTNKVKPFFIRITDDMTPQMVQDAFDKCVDAGAGAIEAIKETETKIRYQSLYSMYWGYFGVDYDGDTLLSDEITSYSEIAKEITLDRLDEWLGLESKAEWDGEGLPPAGVECEIFTYDSPIEVDSMSWHKAKILSVHDAGFGAENIVTYTCNWDPNFYVDAHPATNLKFRKPETPEQKAERERMENGKSLYELVQSIWCTVDSKYTPHPYESPVVCDDTKEMYARLAKAVNYRKQ